MRKDCTTISWKKIALTIAFLLTIANGIWICVRENNTPRWKVAVEIPLVNQNIEWTGAGYNGIWGK